MNPAKARRLFPMLSVESLLRALDFYERGLGAVLAALAAKVVMGPTLQPWGERIAYVADPDGNLVMLTQRVG